MPFPTLLARFAGVLLLLVAAGVSVASAAAEPWGTCTTAATAPTGTGVHTVTQFGTSSGDIVNGIAVNGATGAVAVGGYTLGTFQGQQPNAGSADACVALYSRNGALLWRKQFGTSSHDEVYTVAVDETTGAVAVGGYTQGTLPGQQPSAGDVDAFVALYSRTGALLWLDQFGTSSDDRVHGVAIDSTTGAVAVGGYTEGTLPGQQPNGGRYDAFVALYSRNGSLVWLDQFGSSKDDYVFGVVIDNSTGTVTAAGYAGGTFAGQQQNAGSEDGFMAIHSRNGTRLALHQFGTSGEDVVRGVALDPTAGSVVVAGYTDGTFPGQQQNAGGYDGFIKTIQCPEATTRTSDMSSPPRTTWPRRLCSHVARSIAARVRVYVCGAAYMGANAVLGDRTHRTPTGYIPYIHLLAPQSVRVVPGVSFHHAATATTTVTTTTTPTTTSTTTTTTTTTATR